MPTSAETEYLFRHALVQSAAYELQPPSARARLHALALEILEDHYGTPPTLEPPYWETEFSAHASDSVALELFEHAQAACEISDADAPEPLRRKAAIYLFRAAHLEGAGYRTLSAIKLYRQLADFPGADSQLRTNAHIQAGQFLFMRGEMEEAGAEYQKAEAVLDPNDAIVAELLKCCITTVGSHTDNGPWVAKSHWESSEFWRKSGDTKRQLSSLINYAIWHCEAGDPEVGREALTEAIRLSREVKHRRAEEAAIGTLALLDGHQGRHKESEIGIRLALAMAEEMSNAPVTLHWVNALAAVQHDLGQLEESERTYREVIARAREAELDSRVDYAEAGLAGLLANQGRIDEARELWNGAWAKLTARKDEYTSRTTREGMEELLEKLKLPPLNADGSFPA